MMSSLAAHNAAVSTKRKRRVLIPLRSENPRNTFPFITIALILANIAVFVYQCFFRGNLISLAAVPYEISHGRDLPPYLGYSIYVTLVSSLFLHGGILHIIGNMLYLWIFGTSIEDKIGHMKFTFFYFLCGILACIAHIASEPDSTIPVIGASGAISGILGAYYFLFPRSKVLTAFIFIIFIRLIRIPAVVFLGLWIALQIVNAYSLGGGGGGTAWLAHIGGFFAGLLLAPFFIKH